MNSVLRVAPLTAPTTGTAWAAAFWPIFTEKREAIDASSCTIAGPPLAASPCAAMYSAAAATWWASTARAAK